MPGRWPQSGRNAVVMFKHLDANAFLRYLLNDIEVQAEATRSVIDSGAAILTNEVLAEIVYVLEKVYDLPRLKIAKALEALVECVQCEDRELLLGALTTFRVNRKLDIVDAILAARHRLRQLEILTFDKDLLKQMASDDSAFGIVADR